MKVRCLNCGFTYEIEGTGGEMCPECGCRHWSMRFTEYEKLHDEPEEEKIKDNGLAFEIFEVEDGKKVKVRKIYLNGHIEGFKGDPCIINHIAPKIMALTGLLQQMNRDYRDLIKRYSLADLPIDLIDLSKLYQAELERIMNIVHTI